jgi:hypothetical protein
MRLLEAHTAVSGKIAIVIGGAAGYIGEGVSLALARYVPQRRAPTVGDVINGVLFLTSELSRSISGATLHIDGGTIGALGWLNRPYGDGFMPAPLGGTLERLFRG